MIKIETNKKTRSADQDGSFEQVLDPMMFMKEHCISSVDKLIGTENDPKIKAELSVLKDELVRTPDTMLFTKEASASLKKLARKSSRNIQAVEIFNDLQQCERTTPPLQDDDSITEKACNFLGCTIL